MIFYPYEMSSMPMLWPVFFTKQKHTSQYNFEHSRALPLMVEPIKMYNLACLKCPFVIIREPFMIFNTPSLPV